MKKEDKENTDVDQKEKDWILLFFRDLTSSQMANSYYITVRDIKYLHQPAGLQCNICPVRVTEHVIHDSSFFLSRRLSSVSTSGE